MTDRIITAGVAGWPIGHSLSPRLHGFWLEKYGLNGAYRAYGIKPDDLGDFIRNLPRDNMAGVNLTVPHKEKVFPFLDEVDEVARRIGAVNTVVVRAGRLLGTNTDAYGFLANLKAAAPAWRAHGPSMILGAGGAARAAIVSLLDEGVPEIRLVNRTRARAEKLAAYFADPRVRVGDWADLREPGSTLLQDLALLVNSTTLGMTGQPPLDIRLEGLPRPCVVYDIVYNPLETDLLRQARERGHFCVDGLGMLLHQATPAFHAWFGLEPEVDHALWRHIIAGLD